MAPSGRPRRYYSDIARSRNMSLSRCHMAKHGHRRLRRSLRSVARNHGSKPVVLTHVARSGLIESNSHEPPLAGLEHPPVQLITLEGHLGVMEFVPIKPNPTLGDKPARLPTRHTESG